MHQDEETDRHGRCGLAPAPMVGAKRADQCGGMDHQPRA